MPAGPLGRDGKASGEPFLHTGSPAGGHFCWRSDRLEMPWERARRLQCALRRFVPPLQPGRLQDGRALGSDFAPSFQLERPTRWRAHLVRRVIDVVAVLCFLAAASWEHHLGLAGAVICAPLGRTGIFCSEDRETATPGVIIPPDTERETQQEWDRIRQEQRDNDARWDRLEREMERDQEQREWRERNRE